MRAALLGHTVLPYTDASTDVWDALKDLDADPADPSNVTLFYSRLSTNAAQEYNSGRGWTREHIWPQSLGGFRASSDHAPATDLFALRPAKLRCNSMRNNFQYGEVNATPPDEECRLACAVVVAGGSRICEPTDDVKGQVARALFYMAVAYDAGCVTLHSNPARVMHCRCVAPLGSPDPLRSPYTGSTQTDPPAGSAQKMILYRGSALMTLVRSAPPRPGMTFN